MGDETGDSVYQLVEQLCRNVLLRENTKQGDDHAVTRYIPFSKQQKIKETKVTKAKSLAFGILLKKKNPAQKQSEDEKNDAMSNQDKLFSVVFQLKSAKKHGKAQRLEALGDQLLTSGGFTKDSAVNDVLSLLLSMKNSVTSQEASNSFVSIGDSIKFCNQNSELNLPVTPVYGEIYSFNSGRREYMQYPPSLFRATPSSLCPSPEGPTPFPCYPSSTFQPQAVPLSSPLDLSLRLTIGIDTDFSSLDRNTAVANEATCRGRVHSNPDDEGYSSPDPTSVWENIWEVEEERARTWQCLGRTVPDIERPYLSEAGTDVVHHAWNIVSQNLVLVDPSLSLPPLKEVAMSRLLTDIGYLLAGIPSNTFPYDDVTATFSLAPGVTLSGLSPETLAAACRTCVDCGTLVRRMDEFCNKSEAKFRGLILDGFRHGLSSFLSMHSNVVVTLARTVTQSLGDMEKCAKPLIDQVLFLGRMCHVDDDPLGWSNLPAGISLISYLLDMSVHVSSKPVHLTLVAILRSTTAPYFRFLQSWLFSGECEDTYREFGLVVDPGCVSARDHVYWEQAYSCSSLQFEGSCSFLSCIQQQVHLTGKSLALLRLVKPRHHLTGQFRHLQPLLGLAVSAGQQTQLRRVCQEYRETLEAAAAELTDSLEKKRRKEEEERQRKVRMVRERNEKIVLEFGQRKEARREEERAKRKEILADIQQQVEDHNERKAREEKQRLEDDQRYAEEAKKMEEEVARREEEEAVRIESFYAGLRHQAEIRERKAEWRMRRAEIRDKRGIFHRIDREKLRKEADNVKNDNSEQNGDPTDQAKSINRRGVFSWKSVSLKLDEMGNVVVTIIDNEGNLITDSFQDYHLFSQDVNNQIMAGSFQSLSSSHQEMLVQSVYWRSQGDVIPSLQTFKTAANLNMVVPTRQQNKATALGTNFSLRDDHHPVLENYQNKKDLNCNPVEDVDGTRKKSGSRPIEEVLYPRRFKEERVEVFVERRTEIVMSKLPSAQPYKTTFPELETSNYIEMGGKMDDKEVADGQAFAPLSLIIQNSILIPLRVQTSLVNSALLNHLLVDRQLVDHFTALRNYLLLADGEFGGQLVISLCQLGNSLDEPDLPNQLLSHLHGVAPQPDLLGPAPLNRVLESAISASLVASSDPMADNLTFVLRGETPGGAVGIPGLTLTYRVGWPGNLVLTEEVLEKYSTLFDFLLGLRLTCLSLTLNWQKLKVKQGRYSHRVNLIRHEMLNFLRNLHAYVATQVLEVSWLEFQDNLDNKVTSLDMLIDVQNKYINRALFRCLLNQKAAPVMKIIMDILASITRFSRMVAVMELIQSEDNWSNIQKQYAVFKQYSRFLYSVVGKLAARGYQPHLQDLLLRLNFNGFYD